MKEFATAMRGAAILMVFHAQSASAQMNGDLREVLTVTDAELTSFDGQRALARATAGTRILLASLDGRERVIYEDPALPVIRAELYRDGAVLLPWRRDLPKVDSLLIWNGTLRTLQFESNLSSFSVKDRWLAYTMREPGMSRDVLVVHDLVAETEIWRHSAPSSADAVAITFDLTKDGDLAWQETTSAGSRGYFWRDGVVHELWSTPYSCWFLTDGVNVVVQQSIPPFAASVIAVEGGNAEPLYASQGPSAWLNSGWIAYSTLDESSTFRAFRRTPSGERELLLDVPRNTYAGEVSPAGEVAVYDDDGGRYIFRQGGQLQDIPREGQPVYRDGWYVLTVNSVYAVDPPRPANACHNAFSTARGDIPNTNFSLSVDGVRDPTWLGAPSYAIRDLIRGAVASESDLSGAWRALFDATNLYLFAEVRDERLHADSSQPWQDDSLEVYLDGDASHGAVYDGQNDYQLIFRPGGDRVEFGVSSRRDASGVRFATRVHPEGSGYDMEIAIPWSALGSSPSPGRALGIDVHLNDDDGDGSRAGKLATFASSDDAWARPSSFGLLELGQALTAVDVIARTANEGPGILNWIQTPARADWEVLSGAPDNDAVGSLWWVLWNDEGLHVYVVAQDNVRVSDSAQPWHDDSIEIYIDADGSHGTHYDGQNDYQYIFRMNDPVVHVGARSLPDVEGIRFSLDRFYTAGHMLTASIPWSTLGVTPCEGRRIGIDVHINDDDDGGTRDGKVASFAEVDDAWTNPSSFGLLELGGFSPGYY